MKSERLTDTDIRVLGWKALVEQLGVTGALRFAAQTERGSGDYPSWRHRVLGRLSVDQLIARMRSTPKTRRPRRKR